jgi:hypothetical protein
VSSTVIVPRASARLPRGREPRATMSTLPRAWTDDDRAKAIEVVLNKIGDLWWAYYDVDLSVDARLLSAHDARAVFDAIQPSREGGLCWTGTARQRDSIFAALVQIFRDHPELALEAFRRIFDMNVIPEESGANQGLMGQMNRDERRARRDKYQDALRNRKCEGRAILVAEGDSWFQFPGRWFTFIALWRFQIDAVKDILDHLIRSNRYCVFSLAAGGDWLIKMLRANDYVEPLSQIEPDAFLISGGGNDLLGDGRVANMTLHKRRVEPLTERHLHLIEMRVASARGRAVVFDLERYRAGVAFLAKEFIGFLNLTLIQYFIFFSNLAHSKLASMAVLTHGYDFAIPTRRSTARLISLRRLVNKLMGSGKWLWLPLEQKRLNDDEKRAVIYAMITEFNELLISLAESPLFPHLYHVDCRGIATSEKDWYDEIHLTSQAFQRAASLFDVCIARVLAPGGASKKVFGVADLPRVG